MKVLFSTNIPSPYRVNFFNELGKKCDLTVLFEKGFSDERDESWKNYKFDNFKGIIMKGISINTDSAICINAKKYLKKIKPDYVVISNYSSPTGVLLTRYCIKHKIKYYIEGDGGFAKTNTKGFKYRLKEKMFKNAVGCFSTSKCHDGYYLSQGANEEQLIRYHFTSLYENQVCMQRSYNIDERVKLLYIGQFIHRKGVDVLLNSLNRLKNKGCEMLIVGGEPTEEYLELVKGIDNIKFSNFVPPEEVKKLMIKSDVLVLPTREDIWGLVINEAMACGNAIVTTDKCVAGVELIENDVNGYIFESENSEQLAKIIDDLIINREKIEVMGRNNLEKIKKYTFEQMAIDHIETFEKGEKNVWKN